MLPSLQMGYNLLYGLHKATYDADCALFLSILKEEIKVLPCLSHIPPVGRQAAEHELII